MLAKGALRDYHIHNDQVSGKGMHLIHGLTVASP